MSKVGIIPSGWVRVGVLTQGKGLTPDAIQKYIKRGIWTDGKHYKRDPVGRLVFNMEAIDKWLAS